jgi:hypothetical protein
MSRRRRWSAATAVTLLALAGVVAGVAAPAFAVPPAPDVTSGTSMGVTPGDDLVLFGTFNTNPAADVRAFVDGQGVECEGTPQDAANWNCTFADIALAPGPYTVRVVQSDADGDSPSTDVDLLVLDPPSDDPDPQAPVLDPLPEATFAETLTVTGTVQGDDTRRTVMIDIANGGITRAFCDDVLEPGEEEFSCTADLPLGANIIVASARLDVDDSNIVQTDEQPVVTRYDHAHLTSPVDGDTVLPTVEFEGVGFVGEDVTVYAGGEIELCSATPDDDGEWGCAPEDPLPPGLLQLDVLGSETGYAGSIGVVVSIPAPGVDYDLGPATVDITLDGIPEADAQTEVTKITPVGDGNTYDTIAQCPDTDVEEYPSSGPDIVCPLNDLEPGIYGVYSTQYVGDYADGDESDYFYIPTAPGLTATAEDDGTVTLSGTRESGASVRVTEGDATACTAPGGNGRWTCTVDPAAGSHTYRAVSYTTGWDPSAVGDVGYDRAFTGYSALSPSRTVTAATTTTPQNSSPAVIERSTTWTLGVGGGLDGAYHPGDPLEVTGTGMPAGSVLSAELHSTPTALGETIADVLGTATITTTIPLGTAPGLHDVVATSTAPGALPVTVTQQIEVVAADAPPVIPVVPTAVEPAETDDVDAGAAGSGGGGPAGSGSGDRSDPGAPSALSGSIVDFSVFVTNPTAVAAAAGLALALLVLVAIPTELLGATLEANSGRLGRAFGRVSGLLDTAQDKLLAFTRTRAVAAALITLLVGIIFGFTDPGFGFDPVSVRLVLSCAIAFFVLGYVASVIGGAIVRRVWNAESVIVIQPSIVLFAIAGVILARLFDFSPGFLVGLAIGLELLRETRRIVLGAVLTQFGIVLALTVGAWVAYSLFTPGPDFAGMLVEDTLVAVTAEGLTGLAVAVLPLTFLEGRQIFESSKALWVAVFLAIETAFALIVLPTALSGTEVSDLGVWLLVLVGFAVVTLSLWWWFSRTNAKAAAERNTEQHALPRR